MKKQFLFFLMSFLMVGFVSKAQITEFYHQGFEQGEPLNYTDQSGLSGFETSLHVGGSRSLQLHHVNGQNAVIVLDTIDFSNIPSLSSFTLEFMHICDVTPTTCQSPSLVAVVHVKRPSVNTWTQLTQTYYNTTEGGSDDYMYTSTFSKVSYTDWDGPTPSNAWWKHERFDLDNYFRGIASADRKLEVRLTLMARTASGTSTAGWYLDDIVVKASPQPIIKPTLNMVSYPDLGIYSSSRGAMIVTDVTTTAAQGMCTDSIYVQYKVGSSPVVTRIPMAPVSGTPNRYAARIPFCGYDTVMQFNVIARDATTNHNIATFPYSEGAWCEYHHVRGTQNYNALSDDLSNGAAYPFSSDGDTRNEFVYDAATLAAAGYGPGAITDIAFTIQSASVFQHRERFQIRMRNMPSTYVTSSTGVFFSDFMKVVYDDVLDIEASAVGTTMTIHLQDTFFYAGEDIVMQMFCDNVSSDPAATSIKLFPTVGNKKTIVKGSHASLGINPFTNPDFTFGTLTTTRPHFMFREVMNPPLVYDAGITALTYPNEENASRVGANDSVCVWLKNFGAATMNAVRIAYQLDDNAPVYYPWSGSLAGGDSVRVRLTSSQVFTVGHHNLKAWVEDTITSSGNRYRDHEPYNDTAYAEFISCAGPMSGVRQVGGSGADFETVEDLLFALSRCGINGPLTAKLSAGTYNPITIPEISGVSTTNYIQFEPLSGEVNFVGNGVDDFIINCQNEGNIRFDNIGFVLNQSENASPSSLVRLGALSSGSHFTNCRFTDNTTDQTTTLLAAESCNNIVVDNCTFTGGNIGIEIAGAASDIRAINNRIEHSTFSNQVTNAISASNQTDIVIDSNFMSDVTSNASYVLLAQHCYNNSRIINNKIYSSHGAGCMGVTNLNGTSAAPVIIANNMLVDMDDGVANLASTPLNVISAQYLKVVYNSVKLVANERVNVAAATFGGGVINNCSFQNNVVTCFDTTNYAFAYMPGTGSGNVVNNNVYYSMGEILNKCSGQQCSNLTGWRTLVPQDINSRSANPNFLNGSLVDLRTYSQDVKGCATPISGVTTDMFGTARDAVAPCAGAFEFVALFYDFNIASLDSPLAEYCNAPASIPLNVEIYNSGVNVFDPATSGTVTISYSVNGQTGSAAVAETIPASGSAVIHTGLTLQLPPDGLNDATYRIRVVISSTLDPNAMNDTAYFTVVSRYHPQAPNVANQTVSYGTSASFTSITGLDTWKVDGYSNGRTRPSTVCWYEDSLATIPFYSGNTFVTDPLFDDTLFYVSQKRLLPIMKITEVQINRTGAGVTSPYPEWFNTATKFAVELTNVGDAPANLAGDSVLIVSATAAINNKLWVLPNVQVQPGHSIVLQYSNITSTPDSSATIFYTASVNPAATANFGILYYDGQGMADAVAFNSVTGSGNTWWTSKNVPNYLWAGNGITFSATSAGVRRMSWPSSTVAATASSNTAQWWEVASNDNRMDLGTPRSSLMMYFDNGCEGERSSVHVTIDDNTRPLSDVALEEPVTNSGCGLGDEPVSVTLHNYGLQAVSPIVIHYSTGSTVYTDTITASLAPSASIDHTFSHLLNMRTASDSVFNITVWVDACAGDVSHFNDTNRASFPVRFTPGLPNVQDPVAVNYNTTVTLQSLTPLRDGVSLIWYNHDMQPLDTADSYTTPIMYVSDSIFVQAIATTNHESHWGTMASLTTANSASQPSPYNTVRKYVKEQYMYPASDLLAAGVRPGIINSISFYFDTLMGTSTTPITFEDYTISMGATSLNEFATTAGNWLPVSQVYNSNSVSVSKSTKGWIKHEFDTPFVWDGVSNIVVQVCRSLSSAYSAGVRVRYTTSTNHTLYKADNTNPVCETTAAGSRGAICPDAMFGYPVSDGCQGPIKCVHLDVTGAPEHDMGVEWVAGMDTMTFTSCGNSNVSVNLVNRGMGAFDTNYVVQYSIDGGALTSVSNLPTVAPGTTVTIPLCSQHLNPGRHIIKGVVTATGDTTLSNDTIVTTLNVRFCGGTYTVGTGMDYATIAEALDSLAQVGIAGPVVFNVQSATYNSQLVLPNVLGASDSNTVLFQSVSGNADDVRVVFAPSASHSYVMNIANTGHFHFKDMTFYANGLQNASNAITISDASDIRFDGVTVRVLGTINNAGSSCIVVGDGVDRLTLFNCDIDSGYYSLKATASVLGAITNVTVDSCRINDFYSSGIVLGGVNGISIRRNQIHAGVTIASRALTAIYVEGSQASVLIEKNNINIHDTKSGNKFGIEIKDVKGTNTNRVRVFNNMIALYSTTNCTGSTGILLEGTTKYVNVYYNSVRVETGATATATAAFKALGTVTNIYVLNNIFSNYSKGYAYKVEATTAVSTSNYNSYFSNSPTRLACWGTGSTAEQATLAALRLASGGDANSLDREAFFVSEDDLHLAIGNLTRKAQYNADVPDDIDGNVRTPIPAPTIGAHEFSQLVHDPAIVTIIEPTLSTHCIETDTIKVKVKFYNNGTANETNVSWYAEMEGVPGTTTPTRTFSNFLMDRDIYDSAYIVSPLGIVDTQNIIVHLLANNDNDTTNNIASSRCVVSPAFNLSATSISVPSGCDLREAQITITLKNDGEKPINGTHPIQIGFEAVLSSPASASIPTLPAHLDATLTLGSDLPVGVSRTLTFPTTANLYPTGSDLNITLRARGWVHYQYDLKPQRDTTSYSSVQSYYVPQPPVGQDLHIPYATWDTLWATQINSRPIRWYRDSTQAYFYTNNNYARSCHWDNPPQYFHDSVYYLNCLSDKSCASHFSPIHVYLNPRVNVDVAAVEVVQPYSPRVYEEADTVQVRIINYGSQPATNIPIVYEFSKLASNGTRTVLQTVREVCHETLNQDEAFLYKFDELIQIPTEQRNTNTNYFFRVWTEMPGEMIPLNDTIRGGTVKQTLSESVYASPVIASAEGLDIIRVGYNTLDWEMPEVGRTYLNLGTYNRPEAGVLHVTRGTVDSLLFECANNSNSDDYRTRANLQVFIDYNRDGQFSALEKFVDSRVTSRVLSKFPITIPNDADFGYMKMRLVLSHDTTEVVDPISGSMEYGCAVDFLLYVDPEEDVPAVDAALSRIALLNKQIVDTSDHNIGFILANKGTSPLATATIVATYNQVDEGTVVYDTINWTGNLLPGQSTYVSLNPHDFVLGTTDLNITVYATGDTLYGNNSLNHSYHRFHVIVLSFEDNFDGTENMWYAPVGVNDYSRNFWERGTPAKTNISAPFTAPNVYATSLTEVVQTGKRGNRSVLYSPIIDVSQILSDTISFRLARNLGEGSSVYIEFWNWEHHWALLDASGVSENWYDSDDGFTGNSSGYDLFQFSTAQLQSDFPEFLQFRIVYHTQPQANDNASFGEGCAVDNFSIKRAQRAVDAGVVAITHPTEPKYGQTIYPTVVIHNYGYASLTDFPVAYRPYGSHLAVVEQCYDTIVPGGDISYTFNHPFVVTNDYPDTFQMDAFTNISLDLYHDNDTTEGTFVLHQLDNDMEMLSFLTPQERIVAGDSIITTVILRNFGMHDVAETDVVCVYNQEDPVTEHLDFNALLGRPLQPSEVYNYSFRQRYRASIGAMYLTAYCSAPGDEYIYNDTIKLRMEGITAISDLKAASIVVDTSSHDYVKVELMIENIGARGANNFEVGFWIDNDTTTIFRQTFWRELPLAALNSTCFIFDTTLAMRTAPYNQIVGFVHVDGDNDPSNDTTRVISTQYVDILVHKVQIEENREDTCHVRLVVENIGNLTYNRTGQIRVTINGTSLVESTPLELVPGRIQHLNFTGTVPKNSQRQYEGTGKITLSGDRNQNNNQTSIVEVINYFEGIPLVEGEGGLELQQNYPNPYSGTTTVNFTLPTNSNVRFFIMDMSGRICYQQTSRYEAGEHSIVIDGANYASGVYFYGVESEGVVRMRKMVIR